MPAKAASLTAFIVTSSAPLMESTETHCSPRLYAICSQVDNQNLESGCLASTVYHTSDIAFVPSLVESSA